ncbi:MAG: hypothetical protein VR65_13145 [Desulfobulbaceae bacterium BRH_c16a]|nr:MAG: hypothetical protein VR65_13145 [Desulfobulbaceae bacterium BRH_c16a]
MSPSAFLIVGKVQKKTAIPEMFTNADPQCAGIDMAELSDLPDNRCFQLETEGSKVPDAIFPEKILPFM